MGNSSIRTFATLAGDATMATATDPAARSWSNSLRLAELHKLDRAETEEEAGAPEAKAAVWEFTAKGEGAAAEEEEEAVRGSAAKGEREEDDEEEEDEEQTEQ
jgi:hypothetical protein